MSDTLTEPTVYRPRLGNEGDPCPTCGALMAADQRYCLSCGSRRGTTRVPFPPEPDQVAAPVAPAPLPRPARREGPFAAYPPQLVGIVSGIIATSVLALGLLIGVLFAHKSNDNTAPVAAVPTVAGAAPTAAATAAAPQTAAFTSDWTSGDGWTIQLQTLPKGSTSPAQVAQAKTDAQGKGVAQVGALDSDAYAALDPGNYVVYSGKYDDESSATAALAGVQAQYPDAKVVHVSSQAAAASTPAATATPTATATAVTKTPDELKKQQTQSPEDAQKNTKNAPPTESSSGTAPKKDNKKAGDGSDVTTFG